MGWIQDKGRSGKGEGVWVCERERAKGKTREGVEWGPLGRERERRKRGKEKEREGEGKGGSGVGLRTKAPAK